MFGAGYSKNNARKWHLLNFVVGEPKLSLYKSVNKKIKNLSPFSRSLSPPSLSLVDKADLIDLVQ